MLLRAAPAPSAEQGIVAVCLLFCRTCPHFQPDIYPSDMGGIARPWLRRALARTRRTARRRRPADTRAVLSISRIHLRALTRGRTHAGAMAPGVRRASPVCYRWVDGRLPVRGSAGVRR